MEGKKCDKLIIAVIQGDDYLDAIQDLNEHGFYATVLNSSGGFLRKQSVTVMIGLNHSDLDRALQILKTHGERTEIRYKPLITDSSFYPRVSNIPVPTHLGGVVLFVVDVERHERY